MLGYIVTDTHLEPATLYVCIDFWLGVGIQKSAAGGNLHKNDQSMLFVQSQHLGQCSYHCS